MLPNRPLITARNTRNTTSSAAAATASMVIITIKNTAIAGLFGFAGVPFYYNATHVSRVSRAR